MLQLELSATRASPGEAIRTATLRPARATKFCAFFISLLTCVSCAVDPTEPIPEESDSGMGGAQGQEADQEEEAPDFRTQEQELDSSLACATAGPNYTTYGNPLYVKTTIPSYGTQACPNAYRWDAWDLNIASDIFPSVAVNFAEPGTTQEECERQKLIVHVWQKVAIFGTTLLLYRGSVHQWGTWVTDNGPLHCDVFWCPPYDPMFANHVEGADYRIVMGARLHNRARDPGSGFTNRSMNILTLF
jgi:hypothetical protein